MPRAKVAVIIPARWKSTRFPGKPLHLLAGKPLIQHVWEQCRKTKHVQRIVVATDDMRIAEAAFDFGAEVTMTSPALRTGTDRVAAVAKQMKAVTHVINVQGDEPMISPRLVDELAKTLSGKHGPDMITAANEFGKDEPPENPNAVKVVLDRAGDALYFSRSLIPYNRDGSKSVRYYRHQGIYGYRREVLLDFVKWKPTMLEETEQLEQLRALEHGVKIRVIITRHRSIGVDRPEDAAEVAKLLK